jgi:arylsulfatase
VIKPGMVINDMCAHEDVMPTLAAAAGDPNLVERLKSGASLSGKSFKVHLDGYNLMPFLKGDRKASPRNEFLYWSDDGDLLALRYQNWKLSFEEQHGEISPQNPLGPWQSQFTKLRVPNVYNLRSDPFERGPTSIEYADWSVHRAFLLVPAQALVGKWITSFKEFPPRTKPASFTIGDVMSKIQVGNPGQD